MRIKSNRRSGQGEGGDEWNLGCNGRGKDDLLVGTKSYDIIQKQKEAIQEERSVYLELLEEHNTLLAFLAQQIAERDCLKQALLDSVGQGAIDAAMEKAEASAFEQFGKVMKVS